MTISVQDLLQITDGKALRAAIVDNLVAAGIPADQWRKGAVLSSILTYFANGMVPLFEAFVTKAIGAHWLETAEGDWLTLVARYMYGVERQTATFADGLFTLTNSGTGTYTFGPDQAVFLNARRKKNFRNAAGFTLSPSSTLTIEIIAAEAGSASSSAPGEVDTLVTSMPGVTCTNALSIVGLDEQTDAVLRSDCANKRDARSNRGPRGAYLYWATHARGTNGGPDTALLNGSGNPVNVNRVLVSVSSHTGQVTVWLASPSGAASGEDITAAAASFEDNVRPDGVTVSTLGATEVIYTLPSLLIWAQAAPGLAAADVATACNDAISAYLSTYPLGGLIKGSQRGLYGTGIDGVIKAAHPNVFAVDGSADLALVAGQVAVDGVTVTAGNVRLVSS